MRWLLVAIVAMAGCSDAGSKSEQSYQIAKSTGNAADRCRAAQEVAGTYLKAADQQIYEKWRQVASDDCRLARIAARSADGDLTPAESDIADNLDDDASFQNLTDELNRY